jgi:hypothetical protein
VLPTGNINGPPCSWAVSEQMGVLNILRVPVYYWFARNRNQRPYALSSSSRELFAGKVG